ncbi:hypothetical protein VK792_09385 [Mesobacterium sp. TK19101]|uniref:Uncharacterized protein n=1 Tax=Mesobacterium hydrothermale TaxID=3111907 RepID=A0ABU6HGB4_9RHOB|nr:hypothetical protein [Mesobacterium sp. TK19101]MEC3861495.1 hypothetical protein [Mesobacterium sp. TK19101]
MTDDTPRTVRPRMWAGLALVGAAVTTAACPAQAGPEGAKLWLAAGTAASGEGGEGGEGAAPETASPDAALQIELAKLEAHMLAVRALYDEGEVDEASAIANHPEAEFMDGLRTRLVLAHVPDAVTPAIAEVTESFYDEAGAEVIHAAIDRSIATIRATQAKGPGGDRARFEAMTQVAKDAAAEFAYGVEQSDPVAMLEGRAFLTSARSLAAAMPDNHKPAQKVIAICDEVLPMMAAGIKSADPSAVYGAAARIEIAGLKVR